MDPATWRSHLQARDMASRGRWPDTTTTPRQVRQLTGRDGDRSIPDTAVPQPGRRTHPIQRSR
jgi:hypothetical protein